MRAAVTTTLDILGAAAVVAGVAAMAGMGPALIVGGAGVLAASWRASMSPAPTPTPAPGPVEP